MNDQLKNLFPKKNQLFGLRLIAKISRRIFIIGMALIVGFWLVMASNMGPAYLPAVCNGCLDIWIRMLLLTLGIIIWITTTAWLLRAIVRYIYRLSKRKP